MTPEAPIFFETPAEFRAWLKKNHASCRQQWIGFQRKSSGRPSVTWPESVDQALCFGWIDGLRKTIDENSYRIRFTPRRSTSIWSAVNIRRFQELKREGKVHRAGLDTYAKRTTNKSGVYSYENRKSAVLSRAALQQFKSNLKAWKWFKQQAPWYQRTVIWWVTSAKRADTQQKRLGILIDDSAAGRRIGALRSDKKS